MNSQSIRSQRIIVFALLINLVMFAIMPGSIMDAKALTGFVKTSPANGAVGQPAVNLVLKWDPAPTNPYGYDRYYKYCYYTSGGTCNFQGVLYSTQYTITGLVKSTKYYWQIQVIYCKDASCTNKEKHEANNGTVWSFTTAGIDPPGAFAKVSPANNATNISSSLLTWSSSAGATSYQYCFSPIYIDTECTHLGGWKDIGNVTTYTIPSPDPKLIWGNRYYWQIRASNGGGTTLADSGTWWSFTTADLVGKASLVSPTGIINKSTPTYTWNHVAGVTLYYLWVNNSAGNVIKQWYDAAIVCAGGICQATPSITLNQGDHTWWIQTWNNTGYGRWSDSLTFNAPIPTPPDPATLVSPNGDIGANYSPTYTWNTVPGSTWYYLWVDGPSGNLLAKWYTSAQANCNNTTCSVAGATPKLPPAAYSWKIRTWSTAGQGPWSAVMNFSIPVPPLPGATTLVSPTGNITTNNPTYTWNEVTDATWYYLWVDGPSGNVIKQWYTSADAHCGGGTCWVTPTTTLASGGHSWNVQTWNISGLGPWAAAMSFTTPLPPSATTLVSPTGNITTNNPTYTWNEVTDATWYYLWVNGPSGNVIKQWYTSADAHCGGGTCWVTPTTTLASGAYTWEVQTWNPVGVGPWSAPLTFNTPLPPGKATLSSPNGSIATNNPTYTWNEVTDATWYYLWVNGPSGNVIKQWYTSADAHCGGGTCWVTPTTTLASGAHIWWIQTWNPAGVGPWSDGTNFSTP